MASHDIAQNLRDNNTNWQNVKQAIEDMGVSTSGLTTAEYDDAIRAIVSGSSPVLNSITITPKNVSQRITPPLGTDGYNNINVNAVDASVDENIVPDNIKQGVSILGVNGSYNPSANLQSKNVTPTTTEQVVVADNGYNALRQVTVAGDADLIASNIKKDVNIFGITGSYQGSSNLQDKTVNPTTSQQVIEADQGYDALESVTVEAVDSSIDSNIVPGNIKAGVSILGVNGSYNPQPTLQTKSVSPTTSAQQITPDNGYDGLEEVDIAAVTSSIDSNIVAGNIKKNVSILGVQGSYEGFVPDYQDKVVTPSASNQEITADTGKTLRKVTVEGDNNLLSANIKKNVSIFGVTGSYEGSVDVDIFAEPTSLVAAPVSNWERQLIEYNNEMYYAVKGGNIYKYDDVNDTLTSIYNNNDLFGNNGNNFPYMGVMVGTQLIWNYTNISGMVGFKAFDFIKKQITTLAQNINQTYSTLGNSCTCIATDGFNIYYMDKSNVKIWKFDIETFTPTLVCTLSEYLTSMVYREGFLYGMRGDNVYRINISSGAVVTLFTIGNASNEDYYSSLVADSNYIYLVGGYYYDNNNANKIWRFNDSSDYELIHTYGTAKFRQTSLMIHKGSLYGINSNRYESGSNLRKIGNNFRKDFS